MIENESGTILITSQSRATQSKATKQSDALLKVNYFENVFLTQVGSPAVRLRLARCTAWVKRWSEAMDFIQNIFNTNISLSGIFENYIIKG